MTFDIFAALAQPHSTVVVHNVKLVDVRPGGDGQELLTIEHAGTTRELLGGGRWSDAHSRWQVGRMGYVEAARPIGTVPVGACYFRDYIDQSLRRVPELDSLQRGDAEAVGWRCDARPQGFRAPVGLIPGEQGRFVPDATVAVTLRVPPEFVRECQRVQMTPEQLLRSFVGDLAGIRNLFAYPRADGYGSNGSDERDMAEAWLDRAHGMNAIDLDAEEARKEAAQEDAARRDDFADLLDEFVRNGGEADAMLAMVEELVAKQAANGDA